MIHGPVLLRVMPHTYIIERLNITNLTLNVNTRRYYGRQKKKKKAIRTTLKNDRPKKKTAANWMKGSLR
jgi:hypothetical protein